ncbi:MAG: S-adenosylmethionine:tRNA ribosyltransferase-isomerase [Caldilineales bacterium]
MTTNTLLDTTPTTGAPTTDCESPPVQLASLDFELPTELEAAQPPEARGLTRDEVRLMVSYRSSNRVVHSDFRSLPDFLHPGDLVVVNTSGTLKAALPAVRGDGRRFALHLSTRLPDGRWLVEVRKPEHGASKQFLQAATCETYTLPGGGLATLQAPHPGSFGAILAGHSRLWIASLHLPQPWLAYLQQYGAPIRYKYVSQPWPADYYQTVYATEPGSAEMPSAGRAFTPEIIMRLVTSGVQVAPLILHTGVASLEGHEPPYEEYYRVPESTARLVNLTRTNGGRVIAVGTTVVRALETVTGEDGLTHSGEGWTRLVVTPERGLHAVNAMLTGLHEPKATHLAMLEALAGREHLEITYAEALRERYLWHEFGDLHLILP